MLCGFRIAGEIFFSGRYLEAHYFTGKHGYEPPKYIFFGIFDIFP